MLLTPLAVGLCLEVLRWRLRWLRWMWARRPAAGAVSDAQRHRLLGPLDFPMTGAGLAAVITMTRAVLPVDLIRVGVEAGTIITVAPHYCPFE